MIDIPGLDLARPSREAVWRHLRDLRHKPPGRRVDEIADVSLGRRWNRRSSCLPPRRQSIMPLSRSYCFMGSVRLAARLRRALRPATTTGD
jgi:hypothetical protein